MKRDERPWILVGALALTACVSAVVLSIVFTLTAPAIEHHRQEVLRQAVLRVLPDARRFDVLVWDGRAWTPDPGPESAVRIYRGLTDQGRSCGFAVPAEGAGFMDSIKLIYGWDPDLKRISGMEVLESRETPGLGDKIAKDEAFLNSFTNLATNPQIVAAKERQADNQVDAISGATISSQAVVAIINQSLDGLRDRVPAAEGSDGE